jgi:Holliday junction DNA helicase RuvA
MFIFNFFFTSLNIIKLDFEKMIKIKYMIDSLRGLLIKKHGNEAVIECNGVGYLIFISLNTFEQLPDLGSNAFLLTLLLPKEDAWNLYGFMTIEERELFKLLISVSGIGPKTALLILSSVSMSEFAGFINTGNLLALQKMQGIGKKTAERLVFELKEKISKVDIIRETFITDVNTVMTNESVFALISLGYNKATAEKAVNEAIKELDKSQISVEQIIKKALRFAIK